MSEKSPNNYALLQLSFELKVSPKIFLAQSDEAAKVIASMEGLIWKIWISQEEESKTGGVYLFANRESAEAYLNHPVVQAACSNPAVKSAKSQIWEIENSLSVLTRAPLPTRWGRSSELETLIAGGVQ